MTANNKTYQLIDSLLAEVDRLTARVAELEQTITSIEDVNVNQPLPTTTAVDSDCNLSPRRNWTMKTPDSDILKIKSKGITTFINPQHPFAKDCQSSCVTIIEKGEETSIVAETLGLSEGQWLYTAEVNNNCLEYFNRDYLNLSQAVKTSDLVTEEALDKAELNRKENAMPIKPLTVSAVDLLDQAFDEFSLEEEEEEEVMTNQDLAAEVLTYAAKHDADDWEIERWLNSRSCLADDKRFMLTSLLILLQTKAAKTVRQALSKLDLQLKTEVVKLPSVSKN